MGARRPILSAIIAVLVLAAMPLLAQNPVYNPSFEDGLAGWQLYSYTLEPNGLAGEPVTGCIGPSPCTFDLTNPPPAPDGSNVCGIQSSGSTQNGGVLQGFFWSGGPAILSLSARAYSERLPVDGGGEWDNGSRVRTALLNHPSNNRADVATWTEFGWGSAWSTVSFDVPGPGTYTLFIESVQPLENAVMSTLWDNVTWTELPAIGGVLSDPVIPGDPLQPDSTARIIWTTDVPSTSRVDYGESTDYGSFVEDTGLVTNHIVQLTGLSQSSTYHFKATSAAAGYAPWHSQDGSFKTPIQFEDIFATPGTSGTDFVIVWNTDVRCTSQVEYGLDGSYGQLTAEDSVLKKTHSVTLTGLEEDKTYHFRVWGRNSAGGYRDACSSDNVFHSLPSPMPSLRNGGFEGVEGAAAYGLYPWVQYALPDNEGEFHPIQGLVGPYPGGGPTSWMGGMKARDGAYFIGSGAVWGHQVGGVFQRVQCGWNETITLSAFYSTQNDGGLPSDTRVRLGIDPTGGVDPTAESVQWMSVYSLTSDNAWYPAAFTTESGTTGVVTVFLDVKEWYNYALQVAGIDRASFGPPVQMTVSQLRNSEGDRSAILSEKTVTYVDPYSIIVYYGTGYIKAYVQDDSDEGVGGIAVLFDQWMPDIPNVGDKVTVTGSVVISSMEGMLLAHSWTTTPGPFDLPKPKGISTAAIGGSTVIQPALYPVTGLCTVGMRVRVFGRVTSLLVPDPFYGDLAIVDDGAGIIDQWPIKQSVAKGIRVKFARDWQDGVNEGDYVEATGVVTIEFVDPNGWPNTGDEYYTYVITTSSTNDWHIIQPAASP